MNLKNIFTISLLLFVTAGIVVLTVKSLRRNPQSLSASEGSNDSSALNTKLAIQDGVMVYYFHSNTRCPTCRSIEAYAREAVETGFADELKSKQVVWRVINYETPGNEHYVTDYEVVAPNIVLVMFKDGKQAKWMGLKEVVDEVGDKAAFMDLFHKRLHELLQEADSGLPYMPSRGNTQ